MSAQRRRPDGDPPAMSHQRAEELISNQLDGAIDAADQQALAAHLAGCSSCAYFAAQMGVMGDGLRELPRLPASPTVARQVRERIHQPATLWDRIGGIFSGQLGLAPLAATAALLVAVVAGALLLNRDGDGTADNPTVLASTRISIDRTLTSTRATGRASATPKPGIVILTATPARTPLPNIVSLPSATPTDTAVPTATDTPVPTDIPIETSVPKATETTAPESTEVRPATDVPTETATEIPPTETATRVRATKTATVVPPTAVPTKLPTATEISATDTPEPVDTATPEEPTAKPTKMPTEVPTDTPSAEPDTATPEPTLEPTRGAPTIAPVDSTVAGTDEETPAAQLTDTPLVDEPTETPIGDTVDQNDPAGSDTEIPIAPITGTTEDPIQTPEHGTGGPIEESPTEVVIEGETSAIPDETPGDVIPTPDGGGDQGTGAILDDTSRIAGLAEGTGAPIGQLAFSPDRTLMVVSDASGSSLRVADRDTGETLQELGAGQFPLWSPLSGALLFTDVSDGGATVSLYWRPDNSIFSISDASDEAFADVPAGWVGGTAYYLRIYDSGRLELRGWDAEAGAAIGDVWSSEDVTLSGVHPLQTTAGFLIPTPDSWLLVTPDGGEQALGGNPYGFVGDGVLSPDGSLLALAADGGLAIVDAADPGSVVAQLPYQETTGAGFSWSPDGQLIAVSDGSSITVYTAAGDPVGAATSETGVTIAGPQFQEDGIYVIQTSGEPSLRRFKLGRLLP